jgi:hypothetical protein
MVEIKIDEDKFDERVERIIHNAVGHAFNLKPKPTDQQERKQ